jgi:hypothetical protein
MTMTKREKFLVFLMILVGVVVFMITIVILPMQNKINELELQKIDLENQKLVIDTTLPQLPALRTSQENKLKEANDELAKIESPITAAEFERWMLPLTTKYDMRVTEVTISDSMVAEPDGQVVLVNEPIYGLKTLIQGFSGEIDEVDTAPTSSSTLLKMTVDYNLVTNYTRFKSMLTQIRAWDTSFFVTEADYNFATGIASIKVDAYMIHKISYEGDRTYTGDYQATGDNDPAGDTWWVDDIILK